MDDSWRARGRSRGHRTYKPPAPSSRKSSSPLGSRHRLPQPGPNIMARSRTEFTLCFAGAPDQGQEVVTFERRHHEGSDRADRRRPRPSEEEREVTKPVPWTERPRRPTVGQRNEGLALPDDVVAIARLPREEDRFAVSEPLCLQPSGDAVELLTVQSLEEGKRRERILLAPRGAHARDDLVAVLHPTVEVAPAERPELDRFDRLDRRRADRPRSEEHTSELQSRLHLVCRLLLEKKKKTYTRTFPSDSTKPKK